MRILVFGAEGAEKILVLFRVNPIDFEWEIINFVKRSDLSSGGRRYVLRTTLLALTKV